MRFLTLLSQGFAYISFTSVLTAAFKCCFWQEDSTGNYLEKKVTGWNSLGLSVPEILN